MHSKCKSNLLGEADSIVIFILEYILNLLAQHKQALSKSLKYFLNSSALK